MGGRRSLKLPDNILPQLGRDTPHLPAGGKTLILPERSMSVWASALASLAAALVSAAF